MDIITGNNSSITMRVSDIHHCMGTKLHECTSLEAHLEHALETAENSETKYHIRATLQKLYTEESPKEHSDLRT